MFLMKWNIDVAESTKHLAAGTLFSEKQNIVYKLDRLLFKEITKNLLLVLNVGYSPYPVESHLV